MAHTLAYISAISFFVLLVAAASPVVRARPTKSFLTKQRFLMPQNAARAELGLPPLVWDDKLALFARSYANKRRGDCALEHSNTELYGENIFWGEGKKWSPAFAAKSWVDEKKYYNYKANTCAEGQMCGHYTQVVWNTTTKVGCAKVICDGDKGVFITCNYDPPGNYFNEWPY